MLRDARMLRLAEKYKPPPLPPDEIRRRKVLFTCIAVGVLVFAFVIVFATPPQGP
jgi:hypothetical protein